MNIAWFRDLIIIVCGIISIGVLITLFVMIIALSRRFGGMMNSLNRAIKNLEEITSFARKEIAAPLAQIGGVIQGISKGMEAISGIFRRK